MPLPPPLEQSGYRFFYRSDGTLDSVNRISTGMVVAVYNPDGSVHADYIERPSYLEFQAHRLNVSPVAPESKSINERITEANWNRAASEFMGSAQYHALLDRYDSQTKNGVGRSRRRWMEMSLSSLVSDPRKDSLDRLVSTWNGIIQELRDNVLVQDATTQELAAVNMIIATSNLPLRLDANGFLHLLP